MQQLDKMNFQDPVQKYAECHSWDMNNWNATKYHEIKVGILDNTYFKENVPTFEILVGWILRLGLNFWVINVALYGWKCDPAYHIRRLSLHLFWSDLKIRWWTRVFGGRIRWRMLQRTVGNCNIRKQQHMKNQRETELFRKQASRYRPSNLVNQTFSYCNATLLSFNRSNDRCYYRSGLSINPRLNIGGALCLSQLMTEACYDRRT